MTGTKKNQISGKNGLVPPTSILVKKKSLKSLATIYYGIALLLINSVVSFFCM